VASTCHHDLIDALTRFNGNVVVLISLSSVALFNKSGVAAFLRDVAHNKSLTLGVGVCVTVDIFTGVISGLCVIDGIALAVCVTLGVDVTSGVTVLPACVALVEDAVFCCIEVTSCCILDCILDFKFATFAIYVYVLYKLRLFIIR
jgi:hypothetical protein